MPNLQFNSTQQLILAIPAIIWAGSLLGGFIFGTPNIEQTQRMPTRTRITSSLALVVASWIWALFVRDTTYATMGLLFAVGMTLGWIGDLCMAQLLPIKEHVLSGIASFGLGHIAYIAGLIYAGEQFNLTNRPLQALTLIIWLMIAVVLWYWIVYRGSEKTFLHKASLPYALLLASTSGISMGLALQHPAFIPITIGAGLFLLSDLILATELFNGAKWKYIGDVVWLTYGPGQMLIVLGLALYFIIG